MAMDITAEAAFSIEPYLIPPTVPYIFRLFYIRHGENETRTELRLDHDSVSALNSLSHNGCVTNGDPSVSWEMELCAPYMAVARPTEFFGPGFVVMRKLTNEVFWSFQKYIAAYLYFLGVQTSNLKYHRS